MTGNKQLILDTSIIIELFRGNPDVLSNLNQQETVYVPVIVIGELYLGAYRSANPQKHFQQINDFLARCIVLTAERLTAESYAVIKSDLLKKGKPIPENDIWTAATALQYNLPLYANDKHFEEIEAIAIF